MCLSEAGGLGSVLHLGMVLYISLFCCRWRLGSIRTYNPEQIMLSAAVRRSSRDVKIMKEKLIFSGTFVGERKPRRSGNKARARRTSFAPLLLIVRPGSFLIRALSGAKWCTT